MLAFLKISTSFWVISDIFPNFVSMEEEKKLTEKLLNHEKEAWEELYWICKDIAERVFRLYRNKELIKDDLLHEFYIYLKENPKIFIDFRGTCKLKTYLSSIFKNYLSSHKVELTELVKGSHEYLLKVERKFDKQIRAIGDEPLLHPGGNLTRIPTEFRDEDEEESEAFFEVALDEEKDDKEVDNRDVWGNNDSEAEDNDEEEDIVVDIHEAFEISTDENISDRCKLVRLVLDQMPEKRALVLKKLYFEGKTRRQIATELGMTMGALYNLIKNARHSFEALSKKLNKQQNEKD